ncbi:hypothetical protein J1614_009363 [Plenodomus biglobosus]|nr:hypothetical protein J1614_009363 [Plenodomus biglobosus]
MKVPSLLDAVRNAGRYPSSQTASTRDGQAEAREGGGHWGGHWGYAAEKEATPRPLVGPGTLAQAADLHCTIGQSFCSEIGLFRAGRTSKYQKAVGGGGGGAVEQGKAPPTNATKAPQADAAPARCALPSSTQRVPRHDMGDEARVCPSRTQVIVASSRRPGKLDARAEGILKSAALR